MDQPLPMSNQPQPDPSFLDEASVTTPPSVLSDDVTQSQQDLAAAATDTQIPVDQPVQTSPKPTRKLQPISGPKEQTELGPVVPEPEPGPILEKKEPEPTAEVKDWMRKLEEGETIQLPQPIMDDFGQVLVQAAGQTKSKIILPLNEEELEKGLHQKAIESIRWLAEWCIRVMKMAAGRVFYKAN